MLKVLVMKELKITLKFYSIFFMIYLSFTTLSSVEMYFSCYSKAIKDDQAQVIGWVSENLPMYSNILLRPDFRLEQAREVFENARCDRLHQHPARKRLLLFLTVAITAGGSTNNRVHGGARPHGRLAGRNPAACFHRPENKPKRRPARKGDPATKRHANRSPADQDAERQSTEAGGTEPKLPEPRHEHLSRREKDQCEADS